MKNQALPAYDPRAVQGIGVTYATTPQGADHTAGYAIATNILKVGGFVDPLKPDGQVELSRNLQIATAAIDSTGMCLFIAFAIMDQPDTFQALLDLLNSFYGLSLTGDDVVALGKKVLSAERDFNARAGFTAQDDRLPRFFEQEPIAPGDLHGEGAGARSALPTGTSRRAGEGVSLPAPRIGGRLFATSGADMLTIKLFATFRKDASTRRREGIGPGPRSARSSTSSGSRETRSACCSSAAGTRSWSTCRRRATRSRSSRRWRRVTMGAEPCESSWRAAREGDLLPWSAQRRASERFGRSLADIEAAALGWELLPGRYRRNRETVSVVDQLRLFRSRVAVIGCGGLGGYVIEQLARLGVGTLVLVDPDVFEEHNLNRQLLSSPAHLEAAKVAVARERVAATRRSPRSRTGPPSVATTHVSSLAARRWSTLDNVLVRRELADGVPRARAAARPWRDRGEVRAGRGPAARR